MFTTWLKKDSTKGEREWTSLTGRDMKKVLTRLPEKCGDELPIELKELWMVLSYKVLFLKLWYIANIEFINKNHMLIEIQLSCNLYRALLTSTQQWAPRIPLMMTSLLSIPGQKHGCRNGLTQEQSYEEQAIYLLLHTCMWWSITYPES